MVHRKFDRRSSAVVTAMFVAISTVGAVLAPPAAALHLEQYIEVPQCQPATSQRCPQVPRVKFTVDQEGRVVYQFTANANHCSDIQVRFNVDNYPHSDFLRVGPGQTVSSKDHLSSGDHVLGVLAEGIAGGCNTTGVLNAWGGTVDVDSIDTVGPAPEPVPKPPCKWTYWGAVVIEQDNGLRVHIDNWHDLTAVGPVHLYARGATVPSDRGELLGADGSGNTMNFTIAWFDKNNAHVNTNDYTGSVDPQFGGMSGTTVNDQGVRNQWVAHEHLTCS